MIGSKLVIYPGHDKSHIKMLRNAESFEITIINDIVCNFGKIENKRKIWKKKKKKDMYI